MAASPATPSRREGKASQSSPCHGDYVTISVADLRAKRIEGGVQGFESEPDRRRRLKDRFDTPVLHARRLQMRAPYVPTDDGAHHSS